MFCHIVRIAPAFWLRVQDPADLSFTPLPLLKVSRVLVRLDNVAWRSDQTHGELVYCSLQSHKRRQLLIRAHVSARPLRDQPHCELVYRPFQFQERRQDFFGAHDKTLSVAMGVDKPDRSSFKVES